MDEISEVPAARETETAKPSPAVRRRRAWVEWLVVLLLLAGAGLFARHQFGAAPQPSPGAAHEVAQPVGVAAASEGGIRVVLTGLGTVTPLATVTVRTQINGQLQAVGFEEGQMVRQGDFLAQIDPRPYQAALEQYQGQLARDTALWRQAQADLARYQQLMRQDSIARQQAEDQAFLVAQYAAAMRSDQAQIDAQNLNIAYCHIVAPVTGRVGLRQVDPGNYVQTSDSNGLVVLTQIEPISVVFTLPEDDLPQILRRLHAGAKLPVLAYDRADATQLAAGELATLDNQIDTTTGTVKLRAIFANADGMLFPNQFVNARLLVETLHGVVTAPLAAIQRGAPGTYVYVVNTGDTVSVRPVKTGVADGERVQILSGLAPGERVVVDGTDRLREGTRVTIPAAAGAAAGGEGGAEKVAAPNRRAQPAPAGH